MADATVSGPGDCADPRELHPHFCRECGVGRLFTMRECSQTRTLPHCRFCGACDWIDEAEVVHR